jgi:thymidylate synthase (FAD)
MNKEHIQYKDPTVALIAHGGVGVAELGARTAYDSTDKSENEVIQKKLYSKLDSVNHSSLLEQLVWVNHHSSVVEHITVSFMISDIGRGVLQELSRHRIQSLTVRSTRYTGSKVLLAYAAASALYEHPERRKQQFMRYCMRELTDMLILTDTDMLEIEFSKMYNMIDCHRRTYKSKMDFMKIFTSKKQMEILEEQMKSPMTNIKTTVDRLCKAKSKRNAMDSFKYLVNDNWSTQLVSTWNMRSLKNFMELRDSGAAWFQIRELAKAMYKVLPEPYKRLIKRHIND